MTARPGSSVVLSLFGCAALFVSAVRAETLGEVLRYSLKHNPSLSAAREDLDVTEEEIARARANFLPTITAQASENYLNENLSDPANVAALASLTEQFPGQSYGLIASENIFRGGRSLAQYRQAKADVKDAHYRFASTGETLLVQIATEYAQVCRDRAKVDLGRQSVVSAQALLVGALQRQAQGDASRLDVAEIRTALLVAQTELAQTEAELASARATLKRDVGYVPELLLPPTLPSAPFKSLEELKALAQNAPEVLSAAASVKSARAALEEAKGERLPTVTISGIYEHVKGLEVANETETVKAITVQAKIPLFTGGQVSSDINAARLRLRRAFDLLEAAQNEANSRSEAAWARAEGSRRILELAREEGDLAALGLRGQSRRARLGDGSASDIIAASQAVDARAALLIDARYAAFVANVTALAVAGRFEAADVTTLDAGRGDAVKTSQAEGLPR